MFQRIVVALVLIPLTASAVIAQDFPQVRTLSAAIAERMKDSGRKTVAVVDFTDLEGAVTALGRFFAEEFSVALASTTAGIETINRSHLKALLAEHKLSASGMIDPQTARKLGQIAGVDTLLAGTLTPFGETVRLSLQLIDSNTARVVSASTADIPRTKAIDELLARTVASAPSSSFAGDSVSAPVTAKNSYKNEFLLGSVESVGMSDKMTVSISLQNILRDAPVYLAAECCYGEWLLAIDNNGNRWKVANQNDITPLPIPSARNFARLAPSDKLFVNARLTPDAKRGALVPRPQWISVTGALYMRSDDVQSSMDRGGERKGGRPFTFGVTNIPVPEVK